MGLSLVQYTNAVLHNGLGQYEEALTAADLASAYPQEAGFTNWALVELVEAAARSGDRVRAADAVERLAQTTRPAAPTGGLAPRRVHERWLATATRPSGSTGRRSSGSAAAAAPWPWRALISSTESGCGGRTDGWTHASSSGPPTRCSPQWAAKGSPTAPGGTADRRNRTQTDRPHGHRADRPGSTRREARPRRALQPGNQHPTVHQPPHRRMAPAQGIPQARHQLPQTTPRGATCLRTRAFGLAALGRRVAGCRCPDLQL